MKLTARQYRNLLNGGGSNPPAEQISEATKAEAETAKPTAKKTTRK